MEKKKKVKEFKEKDPTTREASARRSKKTGQTKAETPGSGGSKGDESREEIGSTRYCGSPGCQTFCVNGKKVPSAKGREETSLRQESEEKVESFAGTSRATCGRDEGQVGRQESC